MMVIGIFTSGCGEDAAAPTGAADTELGAGEDAGGFCEVGTAGCSCRGVANLGCVDEGFECIDNICVQCTPGEADCVCDSNGACGGDLECVNTDPDCSFDCEPSICLSPLVEQACGPTALCDRTINECATDLTQEDCEDFYADDSNCRDMAAYTQCNCDCIERDSCEAYFACGNLCFNDHCS